MSDPFPHLGREGHQIAELPLFHHIFDLISPDLPRLNSERQHAGMRHSPVYDREFALRGFSRIDPIPRLIDLSRVSLFGICERDYKFEFRILFLDHGDRYLHDLRNGRLML